MKTNSPYSFLKKSFLIFSLFITSIKCFSQTTDYLCIIDNITLVNPTTISFEIRIENTGTNPLSLIAIQAGINFNYAALVNGGTITGTSVPANSITWNIDPVSKQIRMYALFGSGIPIPVSPGISLGTFHLINTVPFSSSIPILNWSFLPTSITTTNTIVLCSVNGDPLSSNITNTANHTVAGNAVPTLSEWGLIIFAFLLLTTSIYFIVNKKYSFLNKV